MAAPAFGQTRLGRHPIQWFVGQPGFQRIARGHELVQINAGVDAMASNMNTRSSVTTLPEAPGA
jgi:hypothetical protein